MTHLRELATTESERRWYTAADLLCALGRWRLLPRRVWYPLWCGCYRRGDAAGAGAPPPLRLPPPVRAMVDPALAERAVGE